MTDTNVQAVQPTFLEDFTAEVRVASHRSNSLVRGWNAITPEVIEVVKKEDVARTQALTNHYLAKYSA
jgi:hypothetical protein